MSEISKMIVFGPVPSRRLGQSMGINNIPPKNCTYSCIYCQLGKNKKIQIQRQSFYKPKFIADNVENKIEEAQKREERIDYLSFVSDGEPTLDINLGETVDLLKRAGIKIAIITNSSLLWDKKVRDVLLRADFVSVKVDAVSNDIWHKINRPHKSLNIDKILNGLLDFSKLFNGTLSTETMLIKNLNDDIKELQKIADFIKTLSPQITYLSIPTRPPAEEWGIPPDEYGVNMAFQIFNNKIKKVEYLTGYEGNNFAYTGDIIEDLLGITSVHPMREDGINEFLLKAESDWSIVENLIKEGKLLEVEYNNKKFFLRKFSVPK